MKRRTLGIVLQSALIVGLSLMLFRLLSNYQFPPGFIMAAVGISFLSLSWHLITSQFNFAIRPKTRRIRNDIRDSNMVLVVPMYNEDPNAFRQLLESISIQSWRPRQVIVIDDGSDSNECAQVFANWQQQYPGDAQFIRQENAGKRMAQANAFRATPDADYYVTVDSDTVLDKDAIKNGMIAFTDPEVTAAGGIIFGANAHKNLLTRLVDLGFTGSFTNGRASWSALGSVTVQCGAFAIYRADIVHKHLDFYLNQKIFGQHVNYGDDRMLTQLALLEGKSVTQENAIAYTLLPTKISHLLRQRIRWSRSFWWGGMWLIKNTPMSKPAWWLTALVFIQFGLFSVVLPYVLLFVPITEGRFPWVFVIYIGIISFIRNIRYMQFHRGDIPAGQQLINYALSPLSSFMHLFLVNGMHVAGLLTLKSSNWGTRKVVEVGLDNEIDSRYATAA